MITSIVVLIKKLAEAYKAGKKFIDETVEDKLPQTVGSMLEEKAPIIFDKIVADRLEKHELVEDQKLQKIAENWKIDLEKSRDSRDQKIEEGFQNVISKLTSVDSRLQVVQIRLESHEARLHAVEQLVRPVKAPKPAKKTKKRKS